MDAAAALAQLGDDVLGAVGGLHARDDVLYRFGWKLEWRMASWTSGLVKMARMLDSEGVMARVDRVGVE